MRLLGVDNWSDLEDAWTLDGLGSRGVVAATSNDRGQKGWCCKEGTRQREEQRWPEVDDDLRVVANGMGHALTQYVVFFTIYPLA
jgi:hypothetical protein